jgi:hypothetical protein
MLSNLYIPHLNDNRSAIIRLFGYFAIHFVVTCVLSPLSLRAQPDSSNQFTFLPPGHSFMPLRAYVQEPRIGLFKFTDDSNMRLDVGNSVDLFQYDIPSSNLKVTTGIDFMSYSLATGAEGFRLQIDALDGFFGGNIVVAQGDSVSRWTSRLRVLHQSAHLVDGDFSYNTSFWTAPEGQIPYTRNYGELVVAHENNSDGMYFRCYGGVSHAVFVRPADIERNTVLAGFEAASEKIVSPVLSQPSNLYICYLTDLSGVRVYTLSHQLQAGIKLGRWYGKGPSFYFEYYTGLSMFSEYFYEHVRTVGVGFSVDFF